MPQQGKPRLRRVYILPNFFTAFNLFLGWWAITLAMDGQLGRACWMVFAATLLDGLDGAVARLTNTQSDFGGQFDSLSDAISFGVAPAILAYALMTQKLPGLDHPRLILGVCALFTICSCLRLARYNIQQHGAEKRVFLGLPTPASAGALIMSILLVEENILDTTRYPATATLVAAVLPFIVLGLAVLMVSEVPYASLSAKIRIQRHMSFDSLVSAIFLAMLFLALTFDMRVILIFAIGFTYVLGGAAIYAYKTVFTNSRFAVRKSRET